MNKWARAFYQPGLPLGIDGRRVTASLEHIELSRRAAREGAVLLKNESGVLPLRGCRLALFGKGIADYVKGGGGSGDVTVSYVRSIYQGLKRKEGEGKLSIFDELADYYVEDVQRQYGEGYIPGMVKEPEFPVSLADRAAEICDTAVIVISRFSGENWDRRSLGDPEITSDSETNVNLQRSTELFERGDFYLSNAESTMVGQVLDRFSSVVVVLNVGGMVDTSWFASEPRIQGALLALQGGMEGGLAVADLLCGDDCPCGRLSDTYAMELTDYPSTIGFHESPDYVEYTEDIYVGYRYFYTVPEMRKRVLYPFGYGLSYTAFKIEELSSSYDRNGIVELSLLVKNIGDVAGREVVEIYVKAPSGRIGKPSIVLASFGKTRKLEPKESQRIVCSFPLSTVASYDDAGIVKEACWVLEQGEYNILFGESPDVLSCANVQIDLSEDVIVEQCKHAIVPSCLTRRMLSDGSYETQKITKSSSVEPIFSRQEISMLEGVVPVARPQKRCTRQEIANRENLLIKVAKGELSLDQFISSLDDATLIDLTGGQPNTGVANTYGFGNQPESGIPNMMTADGPAGLRIVSECGVNTTAWPCATLLASTWDEQLVEAVGRAGGAEVKENNIGIWLTPAVNIHRSPLCGRNFEYYSEDPLLTGKLAASMVRGIQSNHVGACVKHFAFNNKETNRKDSDSRISERAAREIYLRQFEIIVKEAKPYTIMSSYNTVNGIRASENHDLLTDILRTEWGFEGLVMTDWWNHGEHYLELLAGNDLKMGTGYPERVAMAFSHGALSRSDIEVNVKRILKTLLWID
jgi:beta-glucosidase